MNSVPQLFRQPLGEKGGSGQISTSPIQQSHHWRPRDTLAAAFLFVSTAAFVMWQNSRVAVLWDLGYLLDTSWRIALGQMPYRDFPLAHAPLTFLIQAGLIRLSGRHYFVVVAYAAIAGGLATVLTWRILLRILRGEVAFERAAWLIAFFLAVPLALVGIYSIYPHPIYDCDSILAVLVSIVLLASTGTKGPTGFAAVKSGPVTKHVAALAAGGTAVVPLFFKQNIGLPFLVVVAAGMFVLLALDLLRMRSLSGTLLSQPALVLAGIGAALLAGLGMIAATAGLGNYVHWTLQFAAQRRMPGLASMLGVYHQPSLAWTLPTLAAGLILCHTRMITRLWARVAAFCLIAAPFAGTLVFFLTEDDASDRADTLLALWPLLLLLALVTAILKLRRNITLERLIPFFILAAIHGALLSQQLWGSTYALWPLLMVLVAFVLRSIPPLARPVALGAAAVIATTFLICGGLYAASLERLSYIQIPEGPMRHSSVPVLRGMATPGPFLSNFDELVEFVALEIPQGEGLVLLPGEDPFFYATGRMPQFPVTLFDPATDPYSSARFSEEAHRREIRWVIVKRALQINEDPMPDREQTITLVQRDFALYRRLGGYEVYRRR